MPSFSWATTGVFDASTVESALPTDYGTDITTWQSEDQTEPDLDPTFTLISGRQVVVQACARRLCMKHGAHQESPNDGFDLRRFVNGKWNKARAFSIKTAIERECMKDQRIYIASCKLAYYPRTLQLVPEIYLDTMFGSFSLVLGVDAVSVQILRAG